MLKELNAQLCLLFRRELLRSWIVWLLILNALRFQMFLTLSQLLSQKFNLRKSSSPAVESVDICYFDISD